MGTPLKPSASHAPPSGPHAGPNRLRQALGRDTVRCGQTAGQENQPRALHVAEPTASPTAPGNHRRRIASFSPHATGAWIDPQGQPNAPRPERPAPIALSTHLAPLAMQWRFGSADSTLAPSSTASLPSAAAQSTPDRPSSHQLLAFRVGPFKGLVKQPAWAR
jgi:hypothetical protein